MYTFNKVPTDYLYTTIFWKSVAAGSELVQNHFFMHSQLRKSVNRKRERKRQTDKAITLLLDVIADDSNTNWNCSDNVRIKD